MLITSPGYMQTRSLEAGLGLIMFISGFVFLLPGDTMTGPAYVELRSFMPPWMTEELGGAILMMIAAVRWYALWINGNHSSTPLFRMLGCAVGGGFWTTVAAGFLLAPVPNILWIGGIAATFAAKEVYSGFRTGLDAEALDSLGLRRRAYRYKQRRQAEGVQGV